VVPATSHEFEFNAPTSVGVDRVIRIPYQALKAGDLSYNIAIHPRDLVIVQPLPVGEYYLGGHVARPGVYTLSGRRVTIKQAIVSGGMFDDLAIPQRTEIIRRIAPDREVYVRVNLERIFAGETPDMYLKPNDQIMVGTNMLAPFLSAFRGAFRLTYGFGFLYDRNFAYSTNSGIF
jgi:protein involved in polysaccharide export with SLBB domain